jgi:hypothetical protein
MIRTDALMGDRDAQMRLNVTRQLAACARLDESRIHQDVSFRLFRHGFAALWAPAESNGAAPGQQECWCLKAINPSTLLCSCKSLPLGRRRLPFMQCSASGAEPYAPEAAYGAKKLSIVVQAVERAQEFAFRIWERLEAPCSLKPFRRLGRRYYARKERLFCKARSSTTKTPTYSVNPL